MLYREYPYFATRVTGNTLHHRPPNELSHPINSSIPRVPDDGTHRSRSLPISCSAVPSNNGRGKFHPVVWSYIVTELAVEDREEDNFFMIIIGMNQLRYYPQVTRFAVEVRSGVDEPGKFVSDYVRQYKDFQSLQICCSAHRYGSILGIREH